MTIFLVFFFAFSIYCTRSREKSTRDFCDDETDERVLLSACYSEYSPIVGFFLNSFFHSWGSGEAINFLGGTPPILLYIKEPIIS